MKMVVFTVERDPDGGLVACAEPECIFTQAPDLDSLKDAIRDAVCCHFENRMECPAIRLVFEGREIEL